MPGQPWPQAPGAPQYSGYPPQAAPQPVTRNVAWEQEAFGEQFPNLAGCVTANLLKRFLRALFLSLVIMVPYGILTAIFGLMGIAGLIILIVIMIAVVVVQWFMLTKTGMTFSDYWTKTKWVDVTTGGPITNKGMLRQLLVLDGAPAIIAILGAFISLFTLSRVNSCLYGGYCGGFGVAIIFVLLMSLYSLGIMVASIIAWVQIAQDNVAHRCWTDRLANIVVVDTSLGRDPFPELTLRGATQQLRPPAQAPAGYGQPMPPQYAPQQPPQQQWPTAAPQPPQQQWPAQQPPAPQPPQWPPAAPPMQ